MRVKIESVAPEKKINLKKLDFKGWQPFLGITEEQDMLHRSTYIKFLDGRKYEKRIYISEN